MQNNLRVSRLQQLTLGVVLAASVFSSTAGFAAEPGITAANEPAAVALQSPGSEPVASLFGAAHEAQQAQYEKAIALLERHMTVTGEGVFSLNKAALVADPDYATIPAEVIHKLERSLKKTNRKLRSGTLSLLDLTADDHGHGNPSSPLTANADRCPGSNSAGRSWWGVTIKADYCRTQDLVLALNAGTGAAGVCAVVAPGAGTVVCGVVAAVLGVGSSYIDWLNNRWGRGITIKKPWVGPVVIWHQ